jgi:hypothetical protein
VHVIRGRWRSPLASTCRFDNMKDLKAIREKAGEVNSTQACITNDEHSR